MPLLLGYTLVGREFMKKQELTWLLTYSQDYLELLRTHASCVCCSSIINLEQDHIIAKGGENVSAYNILTRVKLIENGVVQWLCSACNHSKNGGAICKRHKNYLGVWNYLPQLVDLEQGIPLVNRAIPIRHKFLDLSRK